MKSKSRTIPNTSNLWPNFVPIRISKLLPAVPGLGSGNWPCYFGMSLQSDAAQGPLYEVGIPLAHKYYIVGTTVLPIQIPTLFSV